MNIVNVHTTSHRLDRVKKAATHTVTVAANFANFYLLQSADMWTADGWLLTACYDANTAQLRKGDQVARAILADDELLHFAITPAIKHYHEQFALPIAAK